MRIKEIKFKNFGVYRNPKPIQFGSDKEKNVTLIYGVMGAGKTTLFEAINWGLYGEKVVGKNNTIPNMPYIAGKYLLKELNNKEIGEVKIEISFEHEGYDYDLCRIAQFEKKENKLQYLRGNDSVKLYIVSDTSQPKQYIGKTTLERRQIDNIISAVLPFESREYFLFDAEKLDKFSKMDTSREIKSAIKQVLGLTDLDNSKTNLESVKKTLREEYQNLEKNSEIAGTNKIITNLNLDKEKLINSKKEYNIKLKEAAQEFAKNEELLDSFKKERKKLNERRELESKAEVLETEVKAQRKNLKEYLTSAYTSYGQQIFFKTIELMNKWKAEDKFPVKYYNLDFIKKILRDKECFGLWKFKTNSVAHEFFLNEAKKLTNWDRNTQENLTDLYSELKNGSTEAKDNYESIKKEHAKLTAKINELADTNREILDITKEINTGMTDDSMRNCEEKRNSLQLQKDYFNREFNKCDHEIDLIIGEIKKCEIGLTKMQARTKEGILKKKKMTFVMSSIQFLDELHEHYAQDKRRIVESLTNELFKDIFWKKEHFTDVKLTEEYRLIIHDKWDTEGKQTLSAGEREVLSLCFVSALAKSSNETAPFIIDTPFARISREPTNNIAKYLPQHLNQLILFVTDKELTTEAENIYLKRCNKIWTIDFDKKKSESNFMEGKHVKTN
jgi:DNA sulfur modification protein DndD